jgi:hypothetical protein
VDTRAARNALAAERRIHRLEPALWALGLTALRLPFLPRTEQDIDGANFARAVEHFDLAQWAPHPPGYPVYIAAAKLARLLGASSPVRALEIVSLGGAALLAACTFEVLARVFDRPTARLGTALAAASPLLALFAVRPLSDGLGAGLAWAVLALALRADEHRRSPGADLPAALALAVTALLAGVRASALPFALPAALAALLAARRRSLALAGGVVALAAYLVPFVLLVDVRVLVDRTAAHARGHFLDYGGSALTTSDPVLRLVGLVRALWAHGLGGLWIERPATTIAVTAALLVALPFAFGAFPAASRPARILGAASLSYLAWILVGQNIVEQPRHALPLIPVLLGHVAFAARRAFLAQSPGRALVALRRALLVSGLALGVFEACRLAFVQARYPAPVVRIARYVAEQPDAGTLTVATYRFYRWIGWRAPGVRVESVGNLDEAIALAHAAPGRVLVTSEVPGAERLDPGATLMRAATDPFVRYVLEDVRLLDLREGLRLPPPAAP